MENSEVQRLIEAGLPGAQVTVRGDGSHFEALLVSDDFEGKLPVARQKMVFAILGDRITSGELHALTIKAYTPEEWKKASKFQVGSA